MSELNDFENSKTNVDIDISPISIRYKSSISTQYNIQGVDGVVDEFVLVDGIVDEALWLTWL